MSASEDYFDDNDWLEDEENDEEKYSSRSKPRNRKKYVELRRRAEDRMAKKRLKEQLGIYGYSDLDSIEI